MGPEGPTWPRFPPRRTSRGHDPWALARLGAIGRARSPNFGWVSSGALPARGEIGGRARSGFFGRWLGGRSKGEGAERGACEPSDRARRPAFGHPPGRPPAGLRPRPCSWGGRRMRPGPPSGTGGAGPPRRRACFAEEGQSLAPVPGPRRGPPPGVAPPTSGRSPSSRLEPPGARGPKRGAVFHPGALAVTEGARPRPGGPRRGFAARPRERLFPPESAGRWPEVPAPPRPPEEGRREHSLPCALPGLRRLPPDRGSFADAGALPNPMVGGPDWSAGPGAFPGSRARFRVVRRGGGPPFPRASTRGGTNGRPGFVAPRGRGVFPDSRSPRSRGPSGSITPVSRRSGSVRPRESSGRGVSTRGSAPAGGWSGPPRRSAISPNPLPPTFRSEGGTNPRRPLDLRAPRPSKGPSPRGPQFPPGAGLELFVRRRQGGAGGVRGLASAGGSSWPWARGPCPEAREPWPTGSDERPGPSPEADRGEARRGGARRPAVD